MVITQANGANVSLHIASNVFLLFVSVIAAIYVINWHFVCIFVSFIYKNTMCLLFILQKCFYEPQNEIDPNDPSDMDNINESADLIEAQRPSENETDKDNDSGADKEKETEAEKETDAEKEIEDGHRTDDDSASESGASRRSEVVDYTKSTEYSQLVKEIKQNLLCATRLQLKNLSALVRRVAVLLLEFLGSTTLNIDELLVSHVS